VSEPRLTLVPCSVQDARAFVLQHHRHHAPPLSGLFALAAALDGKVVAVAIVGRPVSRMMQDDWTIEVTRLASDGTRNACSFLYRAAWRAAHALGWRRLVTFTLATEPGTSLRAAKMTCLGEAGGGSWSRPSRPRVDQNPTQTKLRWEIVDDSPRDVEARCSLAQAGAALRSGKPAA
jgi:hypothetical protein